MKKKKVIVIGGGFAGIQLIKALDENLFEILLLDKINHHQFQPLFYQVASSQIEPSSISFPLRNRFSDKHNVQIRLAEVHSVNPTQQMVTTTAGNFLYDYLVIAIGCTTNYFGNPLIARFALPLKTTYEAIGIRNHILQMLEKMVSITSKEDPSLYNWVIVGAGPTGVELAGAFAEMRRDILPRDYPGVDFSSMKIILIEGSKHTLNNMSPKAKLASRKYLEAMGVEVQTEVMVKNYDGFQLELNTGISIQTQTVIWAAGVIGQTINGLPEGSITFGNRIKVNNINQVASLNSIYAIGDIAYMETTKYPKAHPQLASVAKGQATRLAKNFYRMERGLQVVPYEYHDLGSMATVGRHKAVVDLPWFTFKGYLAWFFWMFLHLMLILNVRNKLIIFIHWAWAYFTHDSSLRLILMKPISAAISRKDTEANK